MDGARELLADDVLLQLQLEPGEAPEEPLEDGLLIGTSTVGGFQPLELGEFLATDLVHHQVRVTLDQ